MKVRSRHTLCAVRRLVIATAFDVRLPLLATAYGVCLLLLMVGDVEIVEPDKAKMEADHIDAQVSKIGMAFLGMTLGCVRCHDHKFDPIALTDYYGIAGMLRSSPSTHKITWGETDHMGYSVAEGKVHIHDLYATMLHLLGIDHTQLTWNHLGRDFRLTDVHGSAVK